MNSVKDLLEFNSKSRVPLVLQTENAECGLACLVMVLGFYGHKTDLLQLRNRFPVSIKGSRLKDLIHVGDNLKLNCHPVKLELNDLSKLRTPAILHWDMNHFVVLKKATSQYIEINDPASGVRRLNYNEASKHFSGVALEILANSEFKPKNEVIKVKLGDFWSKITGLKSALLKLFILSFMLQVFALAAPYYMQLVVDEVIVSGDDKLLKLLAIGFFMLVVFEVFTKAIRSLITLHFSNLLTVQMSSNLFHHLIRLPLDYFEKRHVGDVISRFGSLKKINELLTKGVVEVLLDGIMAVSILLMISFYSFKLSLIVLATLFIYLIIRLVLYRPLRQLTEEYIISGANEQSNFMETVRGIQSIKLFGNEISRQGLWHIKLSEMLNKGIKLGKLNIGYKAINQFLFGVENVLVIYFAANLVIANELSIGMLFAFIAYKKQFTTKAVNLIEKFIQFKILGLHLERLADIALNKKEKYLETTQLNTKVSNSLKLSNVSFKYSGSDHFLFEDLNFSIRLGESIAIVGSSGCGKTTLMKVMLGLFLPNDGTVYMGDVDINKLGLNTYRKNIAAVMQDDQLLTGSIKQNITFFEIGDTSGNEVQAAAKSAGIHEDILRMPMGYESLIGDMGSSLSGGQKQRVLLARALYRQPKILFLDEATSHLDTKLERKVNQSIKDLEIARVIIAHRPETIRMADKILKLSEGKLIEVTNKYRPLVQE